MQILRSNLLLAATLATLATLATFSCVLTSNVFAAAPTINYLHQIKPLLDKKCAACHGALQQKAGLRLDAGSLLHKGSKHNPVITPGDPSASLLITKVSTSDIEDRMPPEHEGEPLTPIQINLLKQWITQGATYPADETIPGDPRLHWAYQVPARHPIPWTKSQKQSTANPIDAFIAQRYKTRSLQPIGFADPGTWLRRVSLNLTGLSPTVKQLTAFKKQSAKSPRAAAKARNKTIDQLLASERYGERWARHWMDVWRYSDWEGFKNQLRGSARHIWRWRDWIVQSLNDDKGYDRMITEMLAGDELAPLDQDTLRATGFLARNYHLSNRNIWLDNTVEHTFKAFMAVTLNCARCHEHKYDPIKQTAYYQMRAVFEPHNTRTDRVGTQTNLLTDGLARAYDKEPSALTYLYIRGSEKNPDESTPIQPGTPAIFGGAFTPKQIQLPLASYFPALVQARREASLKALRSVLSRNEKNLAAAQSSTDQTQSADLDLLILKCDEAAENLKSRQARTQADIAKYIDHTDEKTFNALAKEAAHAERSHALAAAERNLHEKTTAVETTTAAKTKLDTAKKKPTAVATKKAEDAIKAAKTNLTKTKATLKTAKEDIKKEDATYTSIGDVYPATSTGRRTALASWMADAKNPLTARVAINHIWARHFGAPLVENMFDFGLRSPKPVHAKLLDWLSVELIESDWSMKHIHRLIVSSNTYRLASAPAMNNTAIADANRAIDPDNLDLWQMNNRRLDAETIRDGVLSVAGSLDLSMGGQPVSYTDADNSTRRSVYLQNAYEKQARFMTIFDAASVIDCYRRSASIIPQQALAMANSSMVLSQSRKLSTALSTQVGPKNNRFVNAAFLRVLSRTPTPEEQRFCINFLTQQTTRLSDLQTLTPFTGGAESTVKPSEDPTQRARENLVHILMNHHDFVTVH